MGEKGKNAIIFGASQGIGKGILLRLVEMNKYDVVVAVSRQMKVDSEVLDLSRQHGIELLIYQVDVTNEEQMNQFAQQVQEKIATIDLIINTVGFLSSQSYSPERHIRNVNAPQLLHSVTMNTWPILNIYRVFSKMIRKSSAIKIVGFSARVGSISDNGLGGWYSYRISKAALNMAIRNISIEGQRTNKSMVICGYHPGTVDTDLSRPFTKNYTKNKIFTVTQAVDYFMMVLQNLTPEDSGFCFDWAGKKIDF